MASAAVVIARILNRLAGCRPSRGWRHGALVVWLAAVMAVGTGLWPVTHPCGADTHCAPGLSDSALPGGDGVVVANAIAESADGDPDQSIQDASLAVVSIDEGLDSSGPVTDPRRFESRGAHHDLFPDKTGPPHA